MTQAVVSRPSIGSPTLRCRKAESLWQRFRGLMGSPPLPPGEGLWFPECQAIHTAFVRVAIDLLFLRDSRIVRVCAAVPPWRVSFCREADSVVELRCGEADRLGLMVGQRLVIETIATKTMRQP